MTLPTELLELLALDPPGHVILDAEARVLGYTNMNPCVLDALPASGMIREGVGVEFYQAPDTETNMRSAMSACKALIGGGFHVNVHASGMQYHGDRVHFNKEFTWVTVAVWRDVVAPASLDAFCDEIETLIKPWGGHIYDGFGSIMIQALTANSSDSRDGRF